MNHILVMKMCLFEGDVANCELLCEMDKTKQPKSRQYGLDYNKLGLDRFLDVFMLLSEKNLA